MKLGVLLSINAAIAGVFGAGFIVAPAALLAMYGVELNAGTVVLARLFGAALFGYGLLSWLTRTAAPSEALRAIVISICLADAIAFLAAAQGAWSGAMNAMGWSTVAIYAGLCAAFGSFLVGKQTAAPTA